MDLSFRAYSTRDTHSVLPNVRAHIRPDLPGCREICDYTIHIRLVHAVKIDAAVHEIVEWNLKQSPVGKSRDTVAHRLARAQGNASVPAERAYHSIIAELVTKRDEQFLARSQMCKRAT